MQLLNLLQPFTTSSFASLNDYYTAYQSEVHDLNLTNLLVWHKKHNLHYLEINGYVVYVYHPENPFSCTFSQPVGDYTDVKALKEVVTQLYDLCNQAGIKLSFRHVNEPFKIFLDDQDYPFVSKELEDDFDYVYLSVELAKLSGNRFHKKKNHLNQFNKTFSHTSEIKPITAENLLDAIAVAQKWCHDNGCEGENDLCFEYQGIKEMIQDWDFLSNRGIVGLIIYIEGQPQAMTIAEPLTHETFLIHIEKANGDFNGIYAAINHAMANIAYPNYIYINREQDMGMEGIRKAKRSYHPHHMVKKYDLHL